MGMEMAEIRILRFIAGYTLLVKKKQDTDIREKLKIGYTDGGLFDLRSTRTGENSM
jgi:hypothetical protein